MKLTVQDLAMFLGCDAVDSEYPEEGVFPITLECLMTYEQANDETYPKPILRHISQMTESEFRECGYDEFMDEISFSSFKEQYNLRPLQPNTMFYPNDFKYLISNQFDVFNWIEKGLAISKV